MTTDLLKMDPASPDEEGVLRAASILRDGGLVVFPTETVYGLGADGTNAEAAERIYAAKGRPSDNPLILHIAEAADAEKYAYTNTLYYRLAHAFMPGPLTVILPAKDSVPLKTRGNLATVALRVPSHPIARALIRAAGVPVAAPSANLSGSPSPTVARHVVDDMNGRVDMIIDGGDATFGLESTIVRIDGEDALTILRPGRITPEDLFSVAPHIAISEAVTSALAEGQLAESPGMKYRHYAPKAPLILLDGEPAECIRYIRKNGSGRLAILCYHEEMHLFSDVLPDCRVYDFGRRADESEQAHALFYLLREADKENYDCIYAPTPRKEGIGLALYNRMIRASAYRIVTLSPRN